MFEAQLLQSQVDTSYSVFSPWMFRGGDALLATLEVVEVGDSGGSVVVEVFTKNTEDTGEGENADSTSTKKITGNSVGRTSLEWESGVANVDLLELVRYKFTIGGSDAGDDWVLFRMLSPVWFDSVGT